MGNKIKKIKPRQITAGVIESGKWYNQVDESCCGVVSVLNLYKWYEPKKRITASKIDKIAQDLHFSYAGVYPEILHKYLRESLDFNLVDYKNRIDLEWVDKHLEKDRHLIIVYVSYEGAYGGHYASVIDKHDGRYTVLNNGQGEAECEATPGELAGWLAEEHTFFGSHFFSAGWAFGRLDEKYET
jgi:hypothetical protein